VGIPALCLSRLARSHIRTFGQHMGRLCQVNGRSAVGKETRKTSYVERFNNTLRQRVSRLVRKTLSFSKSLENHIGAIWYFIHYYNASLLV
jgi:IS1 family transposase